MAFVQSKPLLLGLLALLAGLTITVAAVGTASAAKPVDKIEWSNGFPSGEHLTVNIHGKHDDYQCSSETGGGSIFVPENTDDPTTEEVETSQINFMQNKKSSVSELTVHDKCAEQFDGDPILVQLPKGKYQVYTRILAKPKKKNDDDERTVTFYPELVEACNFGDIDGDGVVTLADFLLVDLNGDADGLGDHDLDGSGGVDEADLELWLQAEYGDLTDCQDTTLAGLGILTTDGGFNVFDTNGDPINTLTREKGKSKATNVTQLFLYTGIAFDTSLDLDLDGNLTLADYILIDDIDFDGIGGDDHDLVDGSGTPWADGAVKDGVVDELDFQYWLTTLPDTLYQEFVDEWVFDIADLVVYGWDYENKGSKLVQVRFYPVDQIGQ